MNSAFDYLRDNMKYEIEEMVQRGHYYAIVDEVDSILIDEARTPLIISGPTEDLTELYVSIDKVMVELLKEKDAPIPILRSMRKHEDGDLLAKRAMSASKIVLGRSWIS